MEYFYRYGYPSENFDEKSGPLYHQDEENLLCKNVHSKEQLQEIFKKNVTAQEKLKNLKIQISNLNELDSNIFSNFPNLISISINKCKIKTISPEAFEGLNLLELNLENNEISDAIFLKNLKNLQVLILSNNCFTKIEEGDFNFLLNLKKFWLNCNSIENIHPCSFQSLNNLEEINLCNNLVTKLDKGVFKGLKNLRRVGIGGRWQMGPLPQGIFDDLTDLEELYMNDCVIKQWEGEVFEKLTKLKKLLLRRNQIRKLPEIFSQPFGMLEELRMEMDLTDLHPNSYQGLKKITSITLEKNRIRILPVGLFKNLINLKNLELNENKIAKIEENHFTTLEGLKKLNLNNNMITKISDNSFKDLKNLTTLEISSNKIFCLTENLFQGLISLQTLKLSENLFGDIPENIFLNLSTLVELDLSGNHALKILKKDTFKGLNRLKHLSLQNCGLETLEEGGFNNLPSLYSLDLKKNSLSILESGSLEGPLNLYKLNLSNNKIIQIKKGAFKGVENLHLLNMENNLLREIKTNEFDYLPCLQSLSLKDNKIIKCESNAFVSLKKLKLLDLSNNKIEFLNELEGLNNLKNLYLRECGLKEIKINLQDLFMLDLTGNNFKKFEFMENLKGLMILRVGGNCFGIEEIVEVSKKFPELTIIDEKDFE